MVLTGLHLNVSGNTLDFEGNFTLDEVLGLVYQWFRALPEGQDQARLDAFAAQLKTQNDGLAAVFTAREGTTAATAKE